jgi:hypothetical protein
MAHATATSVAGHTHLKGIASVEKGPQGPFVPIRLQHRLIAFFLTPDAPHVFKIQVDQRRLNSTFAEATDRVTDEI